MVLTIQYILCVSYWDSDDENLCINHCTGQKNQEWMQHSIRGPFRQSQKPRRLEVAGPLKTSPAFSFYCGGNRDTQKLNDVPKKPAWSLRILYLRLWKRLVCLEARDTEEPFTFSELFKHCVSKILLTNQTQCIWGVSSLLLKSVISSISQNTDCSRSWSQNKQNTSRDTNTALGSSAVFFLFSILH